MTDVTEKPKELAEEVQAGRSERTPWLALGGVQLAVAAAVAVVATIAIVAYVLS
jgi:hypothetical protein